MLHVLFYMFRYKVLSVQVDTEEHARTLNGLSLDSEVSRYDSSVYVCVCVGGGGVLSRENLLNHWLTD